MGNVTNEQPHRAAHWLIRPRALWTLFGSALLSLAATAGSPGELDRFVLDAHELHEALVAVPVDGLPLHVPHDLLRENPQLSTEPEFVEAVARGSSQGRLGSDGVRAALYAVYQEESQIGVYGLEAESSADADRLEPLLREIWARNASLERARVHRRGDVLLVVWNAPHTPPSWEDVNAALAGRR